MAQLAQTLGRQVLGRARHRVGNISRFRQSEISQFYVPIGVDQNILQLIYFLLPVSSLGTLFYFRANSPTPLELKQSRIGFGFQKTSSFSVTDGKALPQGSSPKRKISSFRF